MKHGRNLVRQNLGQNEVQIMNLTRLIIQTGPI